MIDKENQSEIKGFWEQGSPMSFIGENVSYEDGKERIIMAIEDDL